MDKLSGTVLKVTVSGWVFCGWEFEATAEPPPPHETKKNNDKNNKNFMN